MAGERPMEHRKKSAAAFNERLDLLRPVFDQIDGHLTNRPSGVGKDDLLDAAVAAWSALRIARGEGQRVSEEQEDSLGLRACIWYLGSQSPPKWQCRGLSLSAKRRN